MAKPKKKNKAQERIEALLKKLGKLDRDGLEHIIVEIHVSLWDPYAEDYPDAEVNGADFIEGVSAILDNRNLGPEVG